MNIKIITTEPFPVGLAASNRIMTYAKGFLINNCSVSIICMVATEDPQDIFNAISSGIVEGINFKYSCGKTIRSKNFINRRIYDILGISRVCIDILIERKQDKTDAIVYYSPSTSRALLLYFITRIKHIHILKEVSELPIGYLGDLSLIQRFFFTRIHYKLFDGFLVMTKRIVKYLNEERKLNKPFVIVPMTVDFSRFSNIKRIQRTTRYIAYCGSLNNKKDGVDLLIDAFVLLTKDFPEIELYLIGGSDSDYEQQFYTERITKYKLTEMVHMTGRVNKNVVPELLCGASVLVLPRPESIQADGGFPTKLGEYLATGNPVVVTGVGEIPDYLTNDKNVFMADPGSIDSLYYNMKKVLLDYDRAIEIGANGKNVALKYFNYEVQTLKIINFIKSL